MEMSHPKAIRFQELKQAASQFALLQKAGIRNEGSGPQCPVPPKGNYENASKVTCGVQDKRKGGDNVTMT